MDSVILRESLGSASVTLYLDSLITRGEVVRNSDTEYSVKLTLALASDDPRYHFIKKGMILQLHPDKWSSEDWFRIWNIKKKAKSVDIVAYHISYDMNGWIVLPFEGNKTYSQIMEWVAPLGDEEERYQNGVYGATEENFPFIIRPAAYTGTETAGMAYPMTLREFLIGSTGDEDNKISVVQDFGGHFEFHGYYATHTFAQYTHTLTINSKYHASDFSVEDRWENYYSAVFPYYILNSSVNPVRIVPGQYDGAMIIPTDSTPGATIDYSRIYMLDVTDDFSGATEVSQEDVIAAATKWMDKNRMRKVGWRPPFEIDVDYISVAQEKISVYDKVQIFIPGESNEPFTKYISETTYDLVKEKYTKLKFVDDNSDTDVSVSGMLAGSFTNGNGSLGQNTVDAMTKNGGVGSVDNNSIIKVTRGGQTYLVGRGAVMGYWFGDTDDLGEKWYSDFECTNRIPLESQTVMFNFGYVLNGERRSRGDSPEIRIVRKYASYETVRRTVPISSVVVKPDDVLDYSTTDGLYLNYTANSGFAPSYLLNAHDPDGGYWLSVDIDTLATDLTSSKGVASQTWVKNLFPTTSTPQAKADFTFDSTTGKFGINHGKWAAQDDILGLVTDDRLSRDDFEEDDDGNIYIKTSKWGDKSWVTGTAIIPWAHISGAPSIPTLSDFVTDTWSSISTKAPNNAVIKQYLEDNYYDKTTIDTTFDDYYNKGTIDIKLGQYLKGSLLPDFFPHTASDDFTYDVSASEFGINSNRWALKSDVKTYRAGNGMVLTASNYFSVDTGTIATRAWVQDNFVQKCLKAGTKIKMADGTDKNIEDVEPGDIVLSYDIQNDTTCEAVVLNMRQTGMAEAYTAMVFDNETYVEVYGEHDIFIDDRQRLECYQYMDSGEKAITTDGSRTTFVFSEIINHNAKSRHYAIVTSNHLYFANGILMGTRPNVTYEYASEIELPDNISSKLRAWADYGKRPTEALLSPENLSAILELSKKSFTARAKMEALGQKLKETDHVSIKRGEGEVDGVSEEVDLDKIRQRRAWRAEVRIHEQEYADAIAAIETYKREHNIPNELSNREKLLYANTEANAAFNEFVEWAQSK